MIFNYQLANGINESSVFRSGSIDIQAINERQRKVNISGAYFKVLTKGGFCRIKFIEPQYVIHPSNPGQPLSKSQKNELCNALSPILVNGVLVQNKNWLVLIKEYNRMLGTDKMYNNISITDLLKDKVLYNTVVNYVPIDTPCPDYKYLIWKGLLDNE